MIIFAIMDPNTRMYSTGSSEKQEAQNMDPNSRISYSRTPH